MGVDSDSSTLAVILLNNQINEVVASPFTYPSVLVCGHRNREARTQLSDHESQATI